MPTLPSGFAVIAMRRPAPAFDLWALASTSRRTEAEMRALIAEHFPA